MNDIDTHTAEVIRFETSRILDHVGDAVRKAQEAAYRMGQRIAAPAPPVTELNTKELGQIVFDEVIKDWEKYGTLTQARRNVAGRLYAMGCASRDADVAELREKVDRILSDPTKAAEYGERIRIYLNASVAERHEARSFESWMVLRKRVAELEADLKHAKAILANAEANERERMLGGK